MSDTVRQLLQGIYEERGRLTPVDVVEVATPVEHPLHGRFTWDDGEAAQRWRESEASHLIRVTKVLIEVIEDGRPVTVLFRAFPNIDGEDYVPLEVVMARPDWEDSLLQEMKDDIQELRRKYRLHAALFGRLLRESAA